MDNLVDQLRRLEQNPPPDVWGEIEERALGRRAHVPGLNLRHRWAAGLLAAVIAVAAIGFLIAVFRSSADDLPTARGSTIIDLGDERNWSGGPIVAGDDAIWIVGAGAERPYEVLRIDPVLLGITDRISLGFADTGLAPTGLAVGHGSVWVTVAKATDEGRWDRLAGELLRIDEATGTIADRFSVPPDPSGVAVGYGYVWLVEGSGKLARIDPSTGRIIQETTIGTLLRDVVPAFGSLWVTDAYGDGSLVRVDPTSGDVQARFQHVSIASAGDDGIWVQGQGEPNGAIRLIDPATNEYTVTPIGLDINPAYIAQGDGQTWLASWVEPPSSSYSSPVVLGDLSRGKFTVRLIDPATGEALGAPIRVCEGYPGQPVIAYAGLWFPCASQVFHLPIGESPLLSERTDDSATSEAVANGDLVFPCTPAGYEDEYTSVLCRMSPDGTGLRELTAPGNVDVEPAWSPDGTRIAFTRNLLDDQGVETGSVIVVMDEAGHQREVPLGTGYHSAPTWAPSAQMIAFVRTNRIYTVRPDGANLVRLTDEPEDADVSELDPSWSPDGSTIAYTSIVYDPASETDVQTINLIGVDGGGNQAITDPSLMASNPKWSPDGTEIAFTSERGPYGDVYLINVDGTGLRRLTDEVSSSNGAAWSPDGTKIVFRGKKGNEAGFYLLDLDTGAVRLLTQGVGGDPTWQPLPGSEAVP